MRAKLGDRDQPTARRVKRGGRRTDLPRKEDRGGPRELKTNLVCLWNGDRHEVKVEKVRKDESLQRRARSEIIYWEHGVGVQIVLGAGLAVVQGIWT